MSHDTTTPHGLSMADISRAIGLSRIVLIVGLVFLHYGTFPNSQVTPFHGVDPDAHSFATWLNSAILFFFFSAVPLLSMISGWLFFSFMAEDAWPSIRKRIRRRFTSLYMPLVVWNIAYFAAIYAMYRMNPHAAAFNHATRFNIDFAAAGWKDYLNSIFAISDGPIAFQFWFVRDLFVTTLVTPIMWLLIQRAPWVGAATIAAIWLTGFNMFIFERPDVPFFFYLGALIHQKHLPMTIPLRATILLVILYVALASVRALAPYAVHFEPAANPFWIDVATRAMRIVGVLGCWGVIYRAAQKPWGIAAGNYGGLAFFLHSAHWPMLAIIKAGLWHFVPGDNDAWMLAHYVASVVLTVTIGLGAGMALNYISPRTFALMNGGRLLGQKPTHAPSHTTPANANPSLQTVPVTESNRMAS